MRGKLVLALALAALASGCATRPENIKAAEIPDAAYSGRSCKDLVAERDALQKDLEFDEKKQRQAATGDAVGVFLIGVPVSSLSGADRETEIAVRKGKIDAIDWALKTKGC